MAYRNFIIELKKYNSKNRHQNTYPPNSETEVAYVDSMDEVLNIKSISVDKINKNKDVNNNKKNDSNTNGN